MSRIENIARIGSYELSNKLGSGAFAVVRLGRHIITDEKVAVKLFDRNEISDEYLLETLYREASILKKLNHPHIIKLLETLEVDGIYCMVLALAKRDVLTALCETGLQTEAQAKKYSTQLISAMMYFHSFGVVHRDLKVENLMLDEDDNIVIIDFGLSNEIKGDGLLTTHCGSMAYSAPELIGHKAYGPPVDIWSFGVCLYVMLSGHLPFPSEGLTMLHAQMLDGTYKLPDEFSPPLKDLFSKIFVVKPHKRASLKDILSHEWFSTNAAFPASSLVISPTNSSLPVIIDEGAVNQLVRMGVSTAEEIKASVVQNNCDRFSAAYYLFISHQKTLEREARVAKEKKEKEALLALQQVKEAANKITSEDTSNKSPDRRGSFNARPPLNRPGSRVHRSSLDSSLPSTKEKDKDPNNNNVNVNNSDINSNGVEKEKEGFSTASSSMKRRTSVSSTNSSNASNNSSSISSKDCNSNNNSLPMPTLLRKGSLESNASNNTSNTSTIPEDKPLSSNANTDEDGTRRRSGTLGRERKDSFNLQRERKDSSDSRRSSTDRRESAESRRESGGGPSLNLSLPMSRRASNNPETIPSPTQNSLNTTITTMTHIPSSTSRDSNGGFLTLPPRRGSISGGLDALPSPPLSNTTSNISTPESLRRANIKEREIMDLPARRPTSGVKRLTPISPSSPSPYSSGDCTPNSHTPAHSLLTSTTTATDSVFNYESSSSTDTTLTPASKNSDLSNNNNNNGDTLTSDDGGRRSGSFSSRTMKKSTSAPVLEEMAFGDPTYGQCITMILENLSTSSSSFDIRNIVAFCHKALRKAPDETFLRILRRYGWNGLDFGREGLRDVAAMTINLSAHASAKGIPLTSQDEYSNEPCSPLIPSPTPLSFSPRPPSSHKKGPKLSFSFGEDEEEEEEVPSSSQSLQKRAAKPVLPSIVKPFSFIPNPPSSSQLSNDSSSSTQQRASPLPRTNSQNSSLFSNLSNTSSSNTNSNNTLLLRRNNSSNSSLNASLTSNTNNTNNNNGTHSSLEVPQRRGSISMPTTRSPSPTPNTNNHNNPNTPNSNNNTNTTNHTLMRRGPSNSNLSILNDSAPTSTTSTTTSTTTTLIGGGGNGGKSPFVLKRSNSISISSSNGSQGSNKTESNHSSSLTAKPPQRRGSVSK